MQLLLRLTFVGCKILAMQTFLLDISLMLLTYQLLDLGM